MRYNEETDMVEILYNGVWSEWKSGNMTNYYLYKKGTLQNDYSFENNSNGYSSLGQYTTYFTISPSTTLNTFGVIVLKTPIDVTNYNTLYVRASDKHGLIDDRIAITTSTAGSITNDGDIQHFVMDGMPAGEFRDILFDVSTVSGNVYLKFGTYCNNSSRIITVTDIWLK